MVFSGLPISVKVAIAFPVRTVAVRRMDRIEASLREALERAGARDQKARLRVYSAAATSASRLAPEHRERVLAGLERAIHVIEAEHGKAEAPMADDLPSRPVQAEERNVQQAVRQTGTLRWPGSRTSRLKRVTAMMAVGLVLLGMLAVVTQFVANVPESGNGNPVSRIEGRLVETLSGSFGAMSGRLFSDAQLTQPADTADAIAGGSFRASRSASLFLSDTFDVSPQSIYLLRLVVRSAEKDKAPGKGLRIRAGLVFLDVNRNLLKSGGSEYRLVADSAGMDWETVAGEPDRLVITGVAMAGDPEAEGSIPEEARYARPLVVIEAAEGARAVLLERIEILEVR